MQNFWLNKKYFKKNASCKCSKKDVFKTSWKTKKCYTEDVFSTSSPRRMFAGLYSQNCSFESLENPQKGVFNGASFQQFELSNVPPMTILEISSTTKVFSE